jgi:hypothetical protein
MQIAGQTNKEIQDPGGALAPSNLYPLFWGVDGR